MFSLPPWLAAYGRLESKMQCRKSKLDQEYPSVKMTWYVNTCNTMTIIIKFNKCWQSNIFCNLILIPVFNDWLNALIYLPQQSGNILSKHWLLSFSNFFGSTSDSDILSGTSSFNLKAAHKHKYRGESAIYIFFISWAISSIHHLISFYFFHGSAIKTQSPNRKISVCQSISSKLSVLSLSHSHSQHGVE